LTRGTKRIYLPLLSAAALLWWRSERRIMIAKSSAAGAISFAIMVWRRLGGGVRSSWPVTAGEHDHVGAPCGRLLADRLRNAAGNFRQTTLPCPQTEDRL